MRRNSGPAIAAGCAAGKPRDKDAIVLALAADHVVGDVAAFVAACREGGRRQTGRIVTFGVKPKARRHRVRLHQPRRGDFRPGACGRKIRRSRIPRRQLLT